MITSQHDYLPGQFPQVEELLRTIGTRGFIGGGMARYVAMSHQLDVPAPSDIDIFPCTFKVWDDVLGSIGYNRTHTLFNCVEYTHPNYQYKVQLVNPHANEYIQMWGSINEVLSNFDFTINQVGLQFGRGSRNFIVVRGEHTMADLLTRTLRIAHMNNPVAMAARTIKYSKLGFSISMSELAKLFLVWDERPGKYKKEIKNLVMNDNRNAEQSTHLYTLLRTT